MLAHSRYGSGECALLPAATTDEGETMKIHRSMTTALAIMGLSLTLTLGCEDVEPVEINAGDVTYGDTSGKTVKEAIDDLKKNQGTKPHTHKASEVSDFSTAAVKAMGTKGTGNALNHDRYGESDLLASATIKALKLENATLKTSVSTLQGEVSTLKTQMGKVLLANGDSDCPVGYTRDTKVTTYTLCKKGNDEVVRVGDFWIDRFEIHIVNTALWNSGKCDGTGGQCYGCLGTFQDNYPATFPDSGNWTAPLYACSMDTSGSTKKHYPPSRGMTWFQAQQACALSGKHLCTNGEWQAAASGTPDSASCNINSKGTWKIAYTGAFPKCISNYGARDMIGNAAEWVDLWGQAGKDWGTSSSVTTPWPTSGGYGDAQDQTANIEGQVLTKYNGAPVNGMPAA